MLKIQLDKESPVIQVPKNLWLATLGTGSVLIEDGKEFFERAVRRGSALQGDVLSQLGELSRKVRFGQKTTPVTRKTRKVK